MALVQIAAAEQQCGGSNFPGVALRMVVQRDSTGANVDVGANSEQVYVQLMLVRRGTGGTGSFNNNGVCAASAVVDGSTRYSSGGLNYDFRSSSGMGSPGAVQMLWQGWVTVPHNADGTKTLAFSGSWTGDSNVGSTSVSGSVVLPKITAVPNAPTGVSAVRVSDSQVTVSWSQSNPGHGVPTSNEYRVRVNGGAWSAATSVSPTTSVSVPASANQKLEYEVRAVNAAGASAWSSTSAPVYTTPAAPSGLTATKDANLDIDLVWVRNAAYSEYEQVVEHSTDNGVTWAELVVLPSSVAAWKHESPDPGETHRYRVKARSTSGGLSSGWSTSANVQLLAAPGKPTLPTLPPFVASDLDFLLTWVHNPVDTTPQTAYEVGFSTDGGVSWSTTGKVASTGSQLLVPASTYAPDDAVTVRVRTWGQATTGGSDGAGGSPWSDTHTLIFKSAPVVTIVSPADSSTYGEAELVVQLGFSQAEGAAFVQATVVLSDITGDLETVVSGSLSGITFDTAVLDGGSYTVTATVVDSNGVVSAPVVSDFDVAYTLPVAAQVTVTNLREQGVAQIDVTIPAAGVGEADAVAVTITRTIAGVTDTLYAGTPVTVGLTTFFDTTHILRGDNIYRVRTISADGAIRDATETLTVEEEFWAFLSTGPGFSQIIGFGGNLTVKADPARESALARAAGRRRPIALYGDQRSLGVSGSSILHPGLGSSPAEVEAFLLDAGLVCYRDCTGRRMFGRVTGSVSSPSSLSSAFEFRVEEAS